MHRTGPGVVVVVCVSLCGCAPSPKTDYQPRTGATPARKSEATEYSFGVIPVQNAVQLFETYQPLMDAINREVSGFTVKLETAKDYLQYEAKVRDRVLDVIMMNPHLVIPAEERGYDIIGRSADRISGVVIVRKGSNYRTPRDLKRASISFANRPDLPGSMMTRVLLKQGGLDPDRDAIPKYVSSPASVLYNVSMGLSAAGCVPQSAWRAFQKEHPDIAQSLQVRWQTESMLGLGILARKEVPREHIRAITRAMFTLDETEEGREILEKMRISSFRPATSASFDSVWEFLNDYRRMFGATPGLGASE